jgi:hypothetical protein
MSDGQVHSSTGASSMYRWEACPGSVRLCKTVPNKSSAYAEEGTKAHEIVAHYLTTATWPKNIETEMFEACKVYTDFVEEEWLKASTVKESWILVEHKFDLSKLHRGLFGTADCVIFNANTKTLLVIDYKHGAGMAVEVDGNSQLDYYALGALISRNAKAKIVEKIIVQPRCFHEKGPVRRQAISAIDLLDFADRLIEAAIATEDPNAPLVPGKHCHFCNASGVCPTIHSKALAEAQEEFRPTLSYNPEKLSHALTQLDVVEAWVKGVREFAYNEAIHGRTPPGWKLVDKRATRKWIEDENIHLKLKQQFNFTDDQIFSRDLKSPTQIEKLLGKDKTKKEKLANFYSANSSGTTLVPENDTRQKALASPSDEFDVIKN